MHSSFHPYRSFEFNPNQRDMEFKPQTIFQIAESGFPKNTTGIHSATKRNGKWTETTLESFQQKVRHFALGLHEMGVKQGDRVALHSENCTEWIIADMAILSLGAVNVPIYSTQPGEQIAYILNDSGAKFYLYSQDKLYNNFRDHKEKVQDLNLICLVETTESCTHMDDVLEKGRKKEEQEPVLFNKLREAVKPEDLASFIYTSGTTGKPKGVMLTHHNIASNVFHTVDRTPFDFDNERGGKILSYLPLSHIFERMLNYLYMHIGFPIYYIEVIDEIKEDMAEVKPIFFGTVPRLLEKIYTGIHEKVNEGTGLKLKIGRWGLKVASEYRINTPPSGFGAFKLWLARKLVFKKVKKGFGGNLQAMISGGAALSPSIMNFFNAMGFECHQGYGLTETSPVLTATRPGEIKEGSSGKTIRSVEVKIAGDGEIWAKGPNIMKGYYNKPDATKEVLTDDGWFKTGDVGRIDEEGFLYITDRKKDIFKLSTGKYVSPQHVENTLLSSALIEQVVVLGASRKFCSALIVPNMDAVLKKLGEGADSKPDFNEKTEQLIQQEVDKMNETLPSWEQIKKFALLDDLFSIDSGELTPTLKTKRRVVHDKYKYEIERIYE